MSRAQQIPHQGLINQIRLLNQLIKQVLLIGSDKQSLSIQKNLSLSNSEP